MTTDQLSALLTADAKAVLENDRRQYFSQIDRAAQLVAANAEQRPIVLLAGPSGSGKTTTALLLERALERMGLETHTLQMDDYFCPLTTEEIALLRENKLDLEKPSRVDIPFFQDHLDRIISGQPIDLPRYDFKTSNRVFEGRTLHRKHGELIIMEGIHALNPTVTGHADTTTRIYVSVRTRLTAMDGSTLHPSKVRLARRLLRDRTCRGRKLTETIAMRTKVDDGEQKYIMPNKSRAHCSIDSFYHAELGVYRPYLLAELKPLVADYPDLADLVHILSELPDVATQLVPTDSLLREFIGGSELAY